MTESIAIYTPLGHESYELCHPTDDEDFETINVAINGRPRRDTWAPIPMRLVREDEGKPLRESDAPWLGAHALVLRRRAVEHMGTLLTSNGELLPLAGDATGLALFNPTTVLDALDEQASSLLRFDDGRIIAVQQHVLRPEVVCDTDVFKLTGMRVSSTFLSDRFVDRWRSGGLTGLDFLRVWKS